MLIGADGYAKITDFGLAKQGLLSDQKTHSFCGTPEYLPPEVVADSGHSFAADWWTFGAFLYEMVVGQPPFLCENRHQLYELIKSNTTINSR